jgi:hypothetical protein
MKNKNADSSDEIELRLTVEGRVRTLYKQIMKIIGSAVDSVLAAFILVGGGLSLALVTVVTFVLTFAIAFGIRALFWLLLTFMTFACFLSTDSTMTIAGTEIKLWIAFGLGLTFASMVFSSNGGSRGKN